MARHRPIRIAPSHYHVGHVVPAMVAKEMNFFEEEGLEDYEIVTGGLIPAIAEKIGLRRAMKEKSIDIVPDAKPLAAFTLGDRGEAIYIIGCWRNRQNACFVGGKDVETLADLKGRKIGARDMGGISYTLLSTQLRKAGLDPEKDVTWVTGARFHGQENSIETLRRGEIDCVSGGGDADVEDLKAEGFHILFESSAFGGVQRPSRITAGTREVIEERRDELEAYFRAIIRGYWFIADRERNARFLNPLVKRLRRACLDVEESRRKSLEAGGHDVLPFDGAPSVEGLNHILKESQETGQVSSSFKLEDILRLEPVRAAFDRLQRREDLKAEYLRAQRVFMLRDAGARRAGFGAA